MSTVLGRIGMTGVADRAAAVAVLLILAGDL